LHGIMGLINSYAVILDIVSRESILCFATYQAG
jgi:hypothetical protein